MWNYNILAAVCCVLVTLIPSLCNGAGQRPQVQLNPYTMKYLRQMLSQKQQQQSRPRMNSFNNRQPTNNNRLPPKFSIQPMTSTNKLSIQPLGVKPLLVKPVYGKTFLTSNSVNNNLNGKYTFAQVQQKPNSSGQKLNPLMVALPNLGNLLYKYAKKQVESRQMPVYNQNIYKMFGQQTYGPMPIPTSSSFTSGGGSSAQQPQVMSQTQMDRRYAQQAPQPQSQPQRMVYHQSPPPAPAPAPAPQPQFQQRTQPTYTSAGSSSNTNNLYATMSRAPAPAPAAVSYQQMNMVRPIAAPAPESGVIHLVQAAQPEQKEMGYGSGGNIHIGNFGSGNNADWGGGMLYISGPAEDIVQAMQQKQPMQATVVQSNSGMTSYTPTVNQQQAIPMQMVAMRGYGQPQVMTNAKPTAAAIGAGQTCIAIPNFCHGKKPGHYTNPGSRHCFMQCDAFGRGYKKECAPGTTWNPRGPEPALYNMCS